jgi:hypothetical protein
MALATEKTWQFTSQIYPYLGNANDTSRYMVWGIKDILVTMGWTVEGGYSTTTGLNNNNQTDPWPAYTDYTRSSSDLWVHMKAPATFGGGNMEIVFGVTYSSTNTYLSRFGITVSHSAGFGTANGGSNGSSSAFPTATDQQQIYDENSSSQRWLEGYTRSLYGSWTTDGKNFRIICKNARVIDSFWSFETLNNPAASLNNDTVCSFRFEPQVADPGFSVMEGDYFTSAHYRGRTDGTTNRSFYLGTLGYANAGMHALGRVYGDNKMQLTACDVYNNGTGVEGYMGTIPDMYYGKNAHYGVLLGDTVGGPANWFSGGSIVVPWDPTEPLPRVI